MSTSGSQIAHQTTAGTEADDDPFLSVVIATRNEASRLIPTVTAITAYLRKQGLSFEIIVADDSSTDDSMERCQALGYAELHLLGLRLRAGRGEAIRDGLVKAQGTAVLLADACLTAPVTDIMPMIESLLDADIVLGATAPTSRNELTAGWPMARSGFKLFRKEASAVLYDVHDFDDDRFDSEVLFVANTFGLHTVTHPVCHEAHDRVHVSPYALSAARPLLDF